MLEFAVGRTEQSGFWRLAVALLRLVPYFAVRIEKIGGQKQLVSIIEEGSF